MKGRLTEEQKRLVEENLAVIDRVISKCIYINKNICGLEYDDLYQIGAIGLCKAAMYYNPAGRATFGTYAFCVVKNALLDYLRNLTSKQHAEKDFLIEADLYLEQQVMPKPEEDVYKKSVMQALEESKARYSGTARKGIEAIALRLQGYSGKDIAQRYSVNANYITACISRAQKYLKKDDVFCRMIA